MSSEVLIPLVHTGQRSPSPDPDTGTGIVEPSAHVGLKEHQARRSLIRYRNLIPTLATFILTSGLGIGVLVWLFYKLKIPVSQAFRDGHFLVDEGVKKWEGSIESATLRALTATSFISTIISATSPLLMALVAYRIAYLWVNEVRNAPPDERREVGPTPLQYGLLLQVLNASSIISIFDAIRYAMTRKYRAQAPSFFVTAVILVTLIFVLTHLVGLADIWMHATTSAVLYNLTRSDNVEPTKASMMFNEALCASRPYNASRDSAPPLCLARPDGWGSGEGDEHLIPMAQSIISNSSSDRQIITLADAEDLAIATPARMDQLATFKANTFGALSKCESLNVLCAPSDNRRPNCTHLGINIIPTSRSVFRSFAYTDPSTWNRTNNMMDSYGVTYGPERCCGTNPITAVLQLRWASQRSGTFHQPNPAVYTREVPVIDIYARCNVTFYNLTVEYDGRLGEDKRWSVVPGGRVPSSDAFASTLAGPLAWQMFMDSLTINVRRFALNLNSTEQVMAALNQELGRLSLGYVAGAFTFAPVIEGFIFQPTILGRYPIAPTFTFVALLLIYGFIALAIFAISLNLTSEVISVPSSLQSHLGDKKKDEVPTLELAQLRLLSPLPLVAQTFEPPICDPSILHSQDADAKSIAAEEMKLFTDESFSTASVARLYLGLEDTNIRPRYGIWRRA